MTAQENKQLMQDIFSELAKGNPGPFLKSLDEDVRWTITGTTKWSRTYEGKSAVRAQLLEPLFSLFASQYTATAVRVITEGDHVVVEGRGQVTTKAGKPYHNSYCWIYRLADGKIKEITEYLDTELVTAALTL